MHILNLISVAFWIFIATQSLLTFLHLRDKGLSRREITSVTILLLCGLNISIGLIASLFYAYPRGQLMLQYFYFGSSVFQLLLCEMVLKQLKNINQ